MSAHALIALPETIVSVGRETVRVPAVHVTPGARIAVLGPNGSGKSTLLRVLAGLAVTQSALAFAVAEQDVVLLPQRPFLIRGTVLWNVALPLRVRGVGREDAETRAREALAQFGVEHLALRGRTKLSGGEAQRAALARAFVGRPRVLLLDEPLGALDDAGAALLADALAADRDRAVVVAAPAASALPAGDFSQTIVLPARRETR